MKQFFDFFPVLLFFIAYTLSKDFMVATIVLMAASAVQVAGFWLWKRSVEKLHLATFAVVMVMGALTLLLDDPIFVVWKPSIVNWTFAVVLLVSLLIGKNLIRKGAAAFLTQTPHLRLDMPENKWGPICITWVLYFIALGVINLYVYFQFGEDFWVTFKLVGFTIINLVFFVAQFLYLSRYIEEIDTDNDNPNNKQESQS